MVAQCQRKVGLRMEVLYVQVYQQMVELWGKLVQQSP